MEERNVLVNTRRFLEDEIKKVLWELNAAKDEMLIEALEENLDELERDLAQVEFELGELI